jgi:glycosyltransferase involved in cell wall biosynthesis
MHIPFIVTIHGLLQNNQTVSERELAIEREFLLISEHKNYSVTVVSSGIKKRLIEDYYKLRNAENIVVIPNGIDISLKPSSINIRRKFGVPLSGRLCIAVGSVCQRKNQIQILKALAAMPATFRKNVWLIIVGKISKDYPIMKEAEKLGLDDRVFFTGFVQHEDIHNYYAAADINIVASKDEGFGLSIIEGFVYGVPTVAFADLDAIQDVYDEKSMILCDERNDEAFAKAIMHACERQWDREAIRQYSKKFSDEAMAEKYIKLYRKVISYYAQ